MASEPLNIGGITPLTTIDYPGELATVVYCQGCPWRCRYCHNGHLLARDAVSDTDWAAALDLLARRRGLLDAVVFSGGEPTLQRGLASAIAQVRNMGFKVGLHTAGCYPERLRAILPSVDWIGLDIKALPSDYAALTGVPGSGERAFESLQLLTGSGVPYEVRVTVHETLLPAPGLQRLLTALDDYGVADVVLQPCRTGQVLDPALEVNGPAWREGGRRSALQWRRDEASAANG